MAIATGRKAFHDYLAFQLGEITKPPLNVTIGKLGQGLDDTFVVLRGHQGDVPVENGGSDRIRGDLDGDGSLRENSRDDVLDEVFSTASESPDGDPDILFRRRLYDLPEIRNRCPGFGRSLIIGFLINVGLVLASWIEYFFRWLPVSQNIHVVLVSLDSHIDKPKIRCFCRIMKKERGRDHVRRKKGMFQRVIDGKRGRGDPGIQSAEDGANECFS